MITAYRTIFGLAMLAVLAGILPRESFAAEDTSLRVFSAWQGQGHILQSGPQAATYIGVLSGRVYVDTEQGPIDSGEMVCPVIVRINLKDRSQQGSGQCTITGTQGNLVFMELNCTGVPLVGCAGDSTLTGGTGPFAQVTGGGHFVLRSSLTELASGPNATLKDTASGIIFWRDLHYKIP